MIERRIGTMIFDADGTLVDTAHLIRHGQHEAVVQYLRGLEVSTSLIPTYEVYESFINQAVGGKTRETFEKTLRLIFDEKQKELFNKIDFDKLDASLSPIQDEIAPHYVHSFPGLSELFDWMGKEKINCGIFTSGTRRHIVRNFGVSLPELGCTDLFRSDDIDIGERLDFFISKIKEIYKIPNINVVTCDDVEKTKPDPEGVLKLMKDFGVKPNEVVLVGDHDVDIKSAKAAGIQNAVGISHGFATITELENAGAVTIVENLSALPELVDAYNRGENSALI